MGDALSVPFIVSWYRCIFFLNFLHNCMLKKVHVIAYDQQLLDDAEFEICVTLDHKTRIPVLLLIQLNHSQIKNNLKHVYLDRCQVLYNFRFHLSVVRNIQLKEMFCPTEILQIEVVNPSIWICCSCYVFGQQFGYFLFAKRMKCSAILYCFYRKTCPRPQDSSFLFLAIILHYFRLFADLFFLQIFLKKLIQEHNLNTNNLLSQYIP